MERLRLKSELLSACDFREIDLGEYVIPLKADPVRYAQDLKKFCRRCALKIQADDVAEEDMVTLRCSSENPKFQKEKITVRVGLGLYSRELEAALVGMRVGQTCRIPVGRDMVQVTVLGSIREIIPELTDETAAAAGIAGVKTAEEARTWCRYQQYNDLLEDAAYEAANHFASQLIRRSKFRLEESEMRMTEAIVRKSVNIQALQEAARDPSERMDSEQFLQMLSENTLMTAVYGQSMTGLTRADYDAYVKRRAAALECTEAEFSAQEPPVEYMINTYSDYFMDQTELYAVRRLKELGEKAGEREAAGASSEEKENLR